MHVVVTGGAGFIGSTLVDALLASGDSVQAVDDLSSGVANDVAPGADLVVADAADAAALAPAFEGAEVVYHLAAHRAVHRSVDHPLTTDRANTHGTLAVLVAAREAGVRRVVYASSSSIYGLATQLPTPESVPPRPRSPYAVSKLAGEQYCQVFTELYGIETIALRYFNVYGPRQRPGGAYATVVPLFIDALRRGRSPELHGDGSQSRDFTFVADAVEATIRAGVAAAARCAGGVYNVAGGVEHTLTEVLTVLGEMLGVDLPAAHGPRRLGDVDRTFADITAAGRDLDWKPVVGLREGLARTIAWMAEEPSPET